MKPQKDIASRADLELLLRNFYSRLLNDPAISYLFTEVARINIDTHIPVLVDFWDMMLFGTTGYRNNTMQVHTALHQQSPLSAEHFDTWLQHFGQTLDELFAGPNADMARQKALQVAQVIRLRTTGQ